MMKFKIRKNPDNTFVKEMMEKIKENDGYCPCKLEKSSDTKCMCKEFRDQVIEGYCHCGLYYKEEIE